jgi:hypothetical protein
VVTLVPNVRSALRRSRRGRVEHVS